MRKQKGPRAEGKKKPRATTPEGDPAPVELDVPERFLRLREVMALTSLSRSTLMRLRRVGAFPGARVLAKDRVAFVRAEVLDWLRTRPLDATAAHVEAPHVPAGAGRP